MKKLVMMKTKYILITLICLFMVGKSDAQIFKKLKEKIAQEVVRKQTVQTSDSTATDTKKTKKGFFSKALGTIYGTQSGNAEQLNIMIGDTIPAPPDNNVKLPDSYTFSYQATMQVKNSQGTTKTEYYLQSNETYYAKKLENSNFTEVVVYDNQRNMEVYFAEIKGEKKKARKKMDIFTKAKIIGAYRDAPNKTVKTIGNKTLLGYTCNGYEISTDAGTTQLWVTNDAPATMYSAMFTTRAEEPDSPFTKNTMIMEVSFIAAQDPNNNYQMAFTQLKTNTLVFSNNDYKK